jgi:type VI protein secretion system component VasA
LNSLIFFNRNNFLYLFFLQDFENDLLSQASRIQDIRNLVRQDYNSSSHQELRSLVNQTSDHAQELFTRSKNYSDK